MNATEGSTDGRDYAVRCLRLNPLWQSDEILAERAERLDLSRAQPPAPAPDRSHDARAETRQAINEVRARFWETPPREVLHQLEELPIEPLRSNPDLAETAERLRRVAEARHATPDFLPDRDYSEAFFRCFQSVAIGTAQERAEVRERVAASLHRRENRLPVRRCAQLLRRRAPALYEVEREWLESLAKQGPRFVLYSRHSEYNVQPSSPAPPPKRDAGEEPKSRFLNSGCLWWLVGFVIVRLIIALARGS